MAKFIQLFYFRLAGYSLSMLRFLLLLSICLPGSLFSVQAQQLPVHTQYFLNPFVYNPAFVGNQGYTELFVTHRRQWIGVEGAPVTTALSLHLPTRSRIAFGANIYNTRQGLLTTTAALVTAGYALQLSYNQYLRAGMSLGFRSNSIDQGRINATDLTDAAFNSAYNNHFGLDANIGFNYQIGQLTLGAALPTLFRRTNLFGDRFNQIYIKPLDQSLLSAAYRFEMEGAAFEPQLLYRRQAGDQTQLEALATIYLRDIFWAGGSYRIGYGPSFFAGATVAKVARIGYAYEVASRQVSGLGNGSHELLLTYQFGENKQTGGKGKRRTKGDAFKERYFQQAQREADKAARQKRLQAQKEQKSQKKAAGSDKSVTASKSTTADKSTTASKPVNKMLPTDKPVSQNKQQSGEQQNKSASSQRSDSLQQNQQAILPGGKGSAKQSADKPVTTTPADKTVKIKKSRRPGWGKSNAAVDQPQDSQEPVATPQPQDRQATEENFQKVERTITAVESNNPDEITQGYYVIVGTFQYQENAERFVKELSGKGFGRSDYKFSSETNYYYVYVLQSQSLPEARQEWTRLRQQPGFEDTWVNVLHVQ